MGKLLILLSQIVVGLNYLFTCFLVLVNFGLGWALISFFVVPIGVAAAPFFVNTWLFFLIGVALFVIGSTLNTRVEKKFTQEILTANESRNKEIAQMTQRAELIGTASTWPVFETDEIRGEGKLFGFKDGNMFWLGDNGISFNIETYVRSWGKSQWESLKNSEDIYLITETRTEFIIPSSERAVWVPWLRKNYPDKEV